MAIGKRGRRRSKGRSAYHHKMWLDTIAKVKVAIREVKRNGGAVDLRSLSDATATLFGEERRTTEKGILGNSITRRLYFRYTTSKPRRTSRIRATGTRASRSKSAAQLRVENADLSARLDASERARRGEIVEGREAAMAQADADARERRRAAPAHVPPSVVDASPGRLKRRSRRAGRA